MLAKNPVRRIVVIVGVALFSAAAALLLFQLLKTAGIENWISRLEAKLAAAPRGATQPGGNLQEKITELKKRLQEARSRFYVAGAVDQAAFGLAVKQALSERGITTEAYKLATNAGEPQLDFSVSGDLKGLIDFLKLVSLLPRYATIDYLSLNALEGDGNIKASLRVGYESLETSQGASNSRPFNTDDLQAQEASLSERSLASVIEVARLFIWKTAPMPPAPMQREQEPEMPEPPQTAIVELEKPEPEPPVVELPVPAPPEKEVVLRAEAPEFAVAPPLTPQDAVGVDWLRYVGSIVLDERPYHIFKDTRSNRILRLAQAAQNTDGQAGWLYVQGSDSIHYLEKDGVTYRVAD